MNEKYVRYIPKGGLKMYDNILSKNMNKVMLANRETGNRISNLISFDILRVITKPHNQSGKISKINNNIMIS